MMGACNLILSNLGGTGNFLLLILAGLLPLASPIRAAADNTLSSVRPVTPTISDYITDVIFVPNKLKMNMGNTSSIQIGVFFDKNLLEESAFTQIELRLRPVTFSPQFNILEFTSTNSTQTQTIRLNKEQLHGMEYKFDRKFDLRATYIGHATIELTASLLKSNGANESIIINGNIKNLEITAIRHEGMIDKIFMMSVIVFITISYINLGAQIDTDNVRRLVDTPRIVFLGFIIGCLVMPSLSWLAGRIFFKDQPIFRIGSFIYACGPAASASVLWTVLFDADKELALGLQIASTVGALFTMPIFLYTMDKSLQLEGHYTIKVPYMNLGRTLIVLLVALCVGSRIVGRSAKARQISQKIFRPLTMFVLLFIIIFSSIVYWYIYKMFDWTITLMALTVTSATYILSGLLGYAMNRDIDQMITISISSTYRNSGIAFAALVVAFQPPDTFIAYVPCLTQVVTTSLIGLILYSIKSVRNLCIDKNYQ